MLLSQTAAQLVAARIAQAVQENDEGIATFLSTHLNRCGTPADAAWIEFEAAHFVAEGRAEDESQMGQIGLTREEAERATQDTLLLAKEFGLGADDPNL